MMKIQDTSAYGDFGADVFSDAVMQSRLAPEVYAALRKTIEEGGGLAYETAEAVAKAMMDWALEKGATHYTHWFQPMTGATAEKRDTFLEFDSLDRAPILDFSAKALIKGEADGSSFPTGGLRVTFEARGYTTWDCTSPAFVKRDANGAGCLCIPTAFCAFSGEALDEKTPLLRSMEALNKQALRVLRLLGDRDSRRVIPTVGAEQEYFLVDKKTFLRRKDLVYAGRTLFGSAPAKGQEMSDQYYAATPDRVIAFMHELNAALWRLGVPCKTEHNEAAPSQYELAPIFVSCNLAVDQNQLVMEMMRRIADKHGMTCLLHEKPFANINGSGKHDNWSLMTDKGVNLLKPGKDTESWKRFYTFFIATLAAVDEYAPLLRNSCSSIGNEHRLGGHEAPTPIISAFIGSKLQEDLELLAAGAGFQKAHHEEMQLGVSTIASFRKDDTDRNRTSPFAFTGNKFEFRMVGSSQSLGMPNTVLNTIVADMLMRIADELEKKDDPSAAWQEVMGQLYREHARIVFNGNNYDAAWAQEAAKRGLPNIDTTVAAIQVVSDPKVHGVFKRHGVFSDSELDARRDVALINYAKSGHIEATTMLKMARQSILPAAAGYSKVLVDTVVGASACGMEAPAQKAMLQELNCAMEQVRQAAEALEEAILRLPREEESPAESAEAFRTAVQPTMERLRGAVDRLECMVDKKYWPLPSYGEILFRVAE